MSDVFGPFLPKSPGLEGHSSWREGTADKKAKQNSINRRSVGSEIIPVPTLSVAAWGARLFLSQLWVGQEVGGEGGQCVLSSLSTLPPPLQSHRRDRGSKPPQAGKGEGGEVRGEEGGEEVTWTTAASQLLERPLGGWTGNTYVAKPR